MKVWNPLTKKEEIEVFVFVYTDGYRKPKVLRYLIPEEDLDKRLKELRSIYGNLVTPEG